MAPDNLVADAALQYQAWLHDHKPILERLHDVIATLGESGLLRGDMFTLAAAVKGWQPDLVLELGRGLGTSTALFRYLDIPVISICRSSYWDRTAEVLADMEPINWKRGVNAIIGEIADQDYRLLLDAPARPMIFWEAHGYDVADAVFNGILPILNGRDVLVACHDMRDSRYYEAHDRPPKDAPLWRQQQEPYDRFLRLGDIHSSFEQLVSIVDFISWNGIKFRSPIHEIMTNPDALALLPPSTGWPNCFWHYFLLPRNFTSSGLPRRSFST
jgi:hypothetical protein